MFNCLLVDRFAQDALIRLKTQNGIKIFSAGSIYDLQDQLATAHGIILRSRTKVTASFLKKCPELKVIISATSGFDHIDLEACKKNNVVVMHTPEANSQSAAELTWGLILATQRKLTQCHRHVLKGDWQRAPLQGRELKNRKLAIIGFGRIGQIVYKMAQAFDMQVVIHDPYVDQTPFKNHSFIGFEEALRTSDIITFHVPLTSETHHMIKPATLEWLQDSTTLINASRGHIICLNSLLQHMTENPDFHVGLDVFPHEPLSKSSALLLSPNVVTTPHVGASTEEALYKASEIAADKLITYVENGNTTDELPPKTPWAEKILSL